MKNNSPIYGFATRMISPEIMEAIFIQRQKFVAYLIESIKESTFTQNKHYDLLVGMRGIGKTFTTSLIFHRLRKTKELEDKLVIAWLQEEEYVSSFLDLLLKIFQVLKQDYAEEYQTKLDSQVEALYKLSADDALRQAEIILKEFMGERTLLLMMENLDEIFKGLGDIGQKQFRAYIQNNNFITILATSQSLFDGIKSREYPFYGFFNPHYLEKLTKEEAQSLLLKIAQLENNPELETFIQSPKGRDRIAAIYHLAGGNHRVYIIFSQFLTRESLDELVQPVMQTLDELTPYYQAKMQWLSPQQRKIVEFLCDRRNAIPVKEIAQRCFITHQTASSQLQDLREKGYVMSESAGRASYYELQEPLMRICLEVKKQRGEPIKLFIDFLRIWYTEKELKRRLQILPQQCLEREYINYALAAKEVSEKCHLISQGIGEANAGNLKNALELFDKAIKINSNNFSAWNKRGITLFKLEKFEDALSSFDKAIEINPNYDRVWILRGITLFILEKFEDALSSFDKAIEINPNDNHAWILRSITLFILEKFEAVIASYNKAIEINPNYHHIRVNLGYVLLKLERFEEALDYANKTILLNTEYALAWFNRIEALYKLNRWEEGFQALADALKRFANKEKSDTGDTTEFIKIIWESTTEINIWKSRLKTLVEIYDRYQATSALNKGIVDNIPNLMPEMVSNKAARTWLKIWQEIAGEKPELSIALRFLKTAVEYKETQGDRKVLLQLAKEERELLESLLKKSHSNYEYN